MDLGIDYRYAGVLLALHWSLTQGAWKLSINSLVAYLLAGCLLNEGARE